MNNELDVLFEDDIRLPIDSDLSFCSFVEAYNLMDDFVGQLFNYDVVNRYVCLRVNTPSYHAAYKMSVASDIMVEVDHTLEDDAWEYEYSCYCEGIWRTKKVTSPGA